MKRCITKNRFLVTIVILLLWSVILVGGFYFGAPYRIALELSPNPWHSITADTYPEVGVTAIDFVNSYHGWLGGENGFIMTTKDGGNTWENQTSGIRTTIQALDFYNAQVGIAISKENHIFVTENGGITWRSLENTDCKLLWDVMICDSNNAWALGCMGRFYRIDIPGDNWTLVSELSLSLFSLAMINHTHGWATGSNGVIVRTQDGWQTWEQQKSDVLQPFYGIFFWNEQKGWVVGDKSIILATTDGGMHWYTQHVYRGLFASGRGFTDVFFISESKGWAVGSGIYYSENGGNSWYKIPHTSGPQHITFANKNHGWAVWYRKERSLMTTVGGSIKISEDFSNIVFVLVLICGISSIFILLAWKWCTLTKTKNQSK